MKLLRFIKKFLTKPENRQIVLLFVAWRIWLFVFALLGLVLLPLYSKDFFGGGLENYIVSPLFWSWANFDGEHYASIAQRGYSALEHSFFPFYPLVISFLAPDNLVGIVGAGLAISSLAFLLALFIFWKLVRLDFGHKFAFVSLVSLLVFPTSFYFGALYTEALFLLLVVGAFYAARKKVWLAAGVLGAAASATRPIGIFLLPALLWEWYHQTKSEGSVRVIRGSVWEILGLFLVPLGLAGYMFFSYKTTGSPLTFYTDLSPFGEQRGGGQIVFLPQIFWRYVKMVFGVHIFSPLYLTILLEFVSALLGLALLMYGAVKKMRFSYLLFSGLGYILPTLTGSFSSLPRYMLVLFPLYVFLGHFLARSGKIVRFLLLVVSLFLLTVETALFVRGYWVG